MRKTDMKKAYFYPIKDFDGKLLDLMNVLSYVRVGDKLVLNRVDTFIGRADRDEYINVARAKDLSAPGLFFGMLPLFRNRRCILIFIWTAITGTCKGRFIRRKDHFTSRPEQLQERTICGTWLGLISFEGSGPNGGFEPKYRYRGDNRRKHNNWH